MGFITAGYDGTVDEVQFANLLKRYSVVGAEDFKAATQAGDRIVVISDGTALGPGTIDVATGIPPIQFAAAPAGTTRWDLVALRRDWQPPGGTSSIVIVQGGTTKGYPEVGTAVTAWNRRPGIMDDQPLYLQEVNGTLLGSRVDLRVWAGNGGGLYAKDDLVRTYLTTIGTRVKIAGITSSLELGTNDAPAWVREPPAGVRAYSATDWVNGAIPLSTSPDGNNIVLAQIAVPDLGYPFHLQVQGLVEGGGGGAGTRWDVRIEIPGERLALSRGDAVAPWWDLNGQTTVPVTGPVTVTLSLARLFGSGAFGLSASNRVFRVMAIPAATS